MKKIVPLLLAGLMLIFTFSACAAETTTSQAPATSSDAPAAVSSSAAAPETSATTSEQINPSGKKLKIGFAMVCTWSSYAAKYIQEFMAQATLRDWEVTMLDANLDAAAQTSQMDNLIAQKPDIIVVLPVDGMAIVPSIKKAYEAGIPVMVVNSNCDESGQQYLKCFVGPDCYLQGQMVADIMHDYFVENLGGKGNAVVIRGTVGYNAADDRTNGFLDKVESDYSDSITVLAVDDCGWLRDKSQSIMENYITRYGETINAVYGMDDNVATGAINAISAAGLTGICVVGLGGDADGLQDIKDGTMYATVMQIPAEEVKAAFIAMDRIAAGEDPDTKQIEMYMPIITAENVDQFEPAY